MPGRVLLGRDARLQPGLEMTFARSRVPSSFLRLAWLLVLDAAGFQERSWRSASDGRHVPRTHYSAFEDRGSIATPTHIDTAYPLNENARPLY